MIYVHCCCVLFFFLCPLFCCCWYVYYTLIIYVGYFLFCRIGRVYIWQRSSCSMICDRIVQDINSMELSSTATWLGAPPKFPLNLSIMINVGGVKLYQCEDFSRWGENLKLPLKLGFCFFSCCLNCQRIAVFWFLFDVKWSPCVGWASVSNQSAPNHKWQELTNCGHLR